MSTRNTAPKKADSDKFRAAALTMILGLGGVETRRRETTYTGRNGREVACTYVELEIPLPAGARISVNVWEDAVMLNLRVYDLEKYRTVDRYTLGTYGSGKFNAHAWDAGYDLGQLVNVAENRIRRVVRNVTALEGPASPKTFRVAERVGRARHVVSHHDGLKRHGDGSPFFDVALFGSKRERDAFTRDLLAKGYAEA